MRARVVVLTLVPVFLAAATVSAAVLPVVGPLRPVTPAGAAWHDAPFTEIPLPSGLSLDFEGVFVLRSAAQWGAFWQSLPEGEMSLLPEVDFSRQIAVVASFGVKPENYALDITKLRTNGAQIALSITRQFPNAEGCHYEDFQAFVGTLALVGRTAVADPSTASAGVVYSTTFASPEPSHVHWCWC